MARRINVYAAGASHAASLVSSGKIKDSASWNPPSADSENAYVQANGLAAFGRWHLGVDPDAAEDTKGRFAFIFTSDWQKVDLSGLRACVTRAAQSGHTEVESRARSLLQAANEKLGKGLEPSAKLWRPFEVKQLDETGVITGYGSVFGVEDWYQDIVMPGAFDKSLAERRPLMLWQHDSRQPIGVWNVAREDRKGLYLEGRFVLETQAGREAHALTKAGALDGLSIGYETLRYEYDEKTGVRKLLEVDLWEVSPVSFPANEAARIQAVKSRGLKPTIRVLEGALRDAGLSRAEAQTVLASGYGALRDAAAQEEQQAGNSLRDAAGREDVMASARRLAAKFTV